MPYINIKSDFGTETIDQIDRLDFGTYTEFRKELLRLIGEYKLGGMNVYSSQRACKNWNI